MAESESGQDKTEDPTEKRKKDSREKGEIARSKELNTLAVMLAGSGGLLIYGGGLALDMMELMKLNFSLPREVLLSPGAMGQYLLHSGKIAILAVQPVLITLLLAALIGPVSLGGWLFAAGSMAPKFSRMNPGPGLKRKLFKLGEVDKIDFEGIKPDRRTIFPAGLAILEAIFDALELQRMDHCDGALREGVLYDLLGRHHHEDVRERTLSSLMDRYHVDREQAARVERKALRAFDQVAKSWGLKDGVWRELLSWAAKVHEVGLDIAHYHYHKHGAYLIEHSDLAGFSREDQQMLALLVRGHRRNIPKDKFAEFGEDGIKLIRLCVLLRFAILFYHIRGNQEASQVKLRAEGDHLDVIFPDGWLEQNPLTQADFEQEAQWLTRVGIVLTVS